MSPHAQKWPMSFFRKAGKKFEEVKHEFSTASKSPFFCEACDSDLTEDYDNCPYCGESTVMANEDE